MNLDDVLRSVLDEAADTTPAAPGSGVPDVLRRAAAIRRRRTVAQAGSVALVAAAVVVTGVVPRLLSAAPTAPAHRPSPAPSARPVTPDPSASSPPAPAPGRTTAAGTRAGFATITFAVPAGWKVRYPASAGNSEQICIQPDPEPKVGRVFGCAGVELDSGRLYGAEAAGGTWPQNAYRPHQPNGWYTATDVQPCPVNGTPSGPGSLNGIQMPQPAPVQQGFRPVGNRTAYYDRWSAQCQDGYRFGPQAWYLPKSKLLFKDYTGHPETAGILASVRFAR